MRLDIFSLPLFWARILYVVHGTQLLWVSKCSTECSLAASKVTMSLQVRVQKWPMFFFKSLWFCVSLLIVMYTPQAVVGKGRQVAVEMRNVGRCQEFFALLKVRTTRRHGNR